MRERGSIADVIWGSMRFVGAMLLLIAILMIYPDLALGLPKLVMG